MNKTKSIIFLILVLAVGVLLTSCGGKNEEKLSLGVGSYAAVTRVTDADGETDGKGEVSFTLASVLLGGDGKVLECELDALEAELKFTSKGAAVTPDELKTKRELGESYGMKEYGGAKAEWYEQADYFEDVVEGKTLPEIKALAAENGKGTGEVLSAGCTISVSDFIKAIERAVENASPSEATAEDDLEIGIVTETGTKRDATDESEGEVSLEITFSACTADDRGIITAAFSDSVEAGVSFDLSGKSNTEPTGRLTTKREAGTSYGMASGGIDRNDDGVVKEWYEQASAFDSACVGKTYNELSSLETDRGYGNDDLQKAGCTVKVSGLVSSMAKASRDD